MNEIYKNLSLENLENEIWRDIQDYDGKYQVSSLGRVKSLKFGKEKILRQAKMKNGYLYVNLCKEGKIKTCRVNRLVGNAFLDNPNNLPCFNHKNEIKTDNRAVNLEPCDYQYNNTFGTVVQRRVASTDYKAFQARRVASTDWKSVGRKNAEKLSKQVYQYDKNGTLVAIWQSTKECGRNGFHCGNVSECCNGKRKTHRGFIWSYTPIDSV